MYHRVLLSLLLAIAVAAPLAPVSAGEQDEVMILVENKVILPFEPIRRRVVAQTKGDYVGAEFDRGTLTYRFRFLDKGNVFNVDVDARNGQRARRTNSY